METNIGYDSAADLWHITRAFLNWLDKQGYESYDPYDLWGTRFGVLARRVYYDRRSLGLPLIVPLVLVETLCPWSRPLFVKKQRFATADAQLALAFLNLYHIAREEQYLAKAVALADDLLQSSIPGYHGHGWGYPFDWQTSKQFWKKNTPFITATPYCFEAFLKLFDATQESHYLQTAESIARFVAEDLNDTTTSEQASASSYSPVDHGQVMNASAYRAFVLFEAAVRFGINAYRQKAQRNVNFILQNQRTDGSWLYALDNPDQAFIDHFHTCFVLKNLAKLNRHLESQYVERAIHVGYRYYRQALFDEEDNPKSYTIQPRLQIARLEMYNVAEAISLGVLLQRAIPEAFELASKLAARVRVQYQLQDGHFVTRAYIGGIKHTFPFLRWPHAQMFYAITNLLVAIVQDSNHVLAALGSGW